MYPFRLSRRRRSRRTTLITVTAAALLGGCLSASDILVRTSEAAVARPGLPQVSSPGTSSARTSDSGAGQSATTRRICAQDAQWLRLEFDKLTLRGKDTITLSGSDGGRYTLTGRNTQGKAFHTRAFEGRCVTVSPDLKDPGSRYSITSYQSGQTPLSEESVTVAAAGDLCGTACDQTAEVVSAMGPQAVITAGDNAYEDGTIEEYETNYDPYWGQFNDIVYPTPGNHEYQGGNANGYFQYYGERGVPTGDKGYYSFDVGEWHMVALNSNVNTYAGSTQEQWLRGDLAASTKPCTMAFWHHPRFSSGHHGDNTASTALYKALTDYRADVVVNGHDHHYERFAPAMADGRADSARGLRQFVIGTGGRALYSDTRDSAGPSEKFQNNTFGVGRFQLDATGYSFDFKPVAGRSFTDSVSGQCHAKGSYSAS